jgi:hypothetical protein
MWFGTLTYTGAALSLYYFLHNLNETWNKYPWYKLLYMLPWEALTGGTVSLLITAGAMILGLLIVGFLSVRYKRWILKKIEYTKGLPDNKVQMLLERRIITDEQADLLIRALAQGLGVRLANVSRKNRRIINEELPGKDITFW